MSGRVSRRRGASSRRTREYRDDLQAELKPFENAFKNQADKFMTFVSHFIGWFMGLRILFLGVMLIGTAVMMGYFGYNSDQPIIVFDPDAPSHDACKKMTCTKSPTLKENFKDVTIDSLDATTRWVIFAAELVMMVSISALVIIHAAIHVKTARMGVAGIHALYTRIYSLFLLATGFLAVFSWFSLEFARTRGENAVFFVRETDQIANMHSGTAIPNHDPVSQLRPAYLKLLASIFWIGFIDCLYFTFLHAARIAHIGNKTEKVIDDLDKGTTESGV